MNKSLKKILIVLLFVLLPPIAIVYCVLFKPPFWENKWVKIVSISWCIIMLLFVFFNPSQKNTTNNLISTDDPSTTINAEKEDGSESTTEDTPAEENVSDPVKTAPTENEATVNPIPQSQTNDTPATDSLIEDTSTEAPAHEQNYSPNSGVTETVSGYCNDGTYVTGNPSAKGKANACYGHKGWRDY